MTCLSALVDFFFIFKFWITLLKMSLDLLNLLNMLSGFRSNRLKITHRLKQKLIPNDLNRSVWKCSSGRHAWLRRTFALAHMVAPGRTFIYAANVRLIGIPKVMYVLMIKYEFYTVFINSGQDFFFRGDLCGNLLTNSGRFNEWSPMLINKDANTVLKSTIKSATL